MLKKLIHAIQKRQIAGEIRAARPDLNLLNDAQLIEQYIEDCLTEREPKKRDPMSALYKRALLHKGCATKEVYIEKTYQLLRIVTAQNEALQQSQARNAAFIKLEGDLIDTATGLLRHIDETEKNHQADSLPRQN